MARFFGASWRETPSITPLPLAPSIIIRTYQTLAWIHHHYLPTSSRAWSGTSHPAPLYCAGLVCVCYTLPPSNNDPNWLSIIHERMIRLNLWKDSRFLLYDTIPPHYVGRSRLVAFFALPNTSTDARRWDESTASKVRAFDLNGHH